MKKSVKFSISCLACITLLLASISCSDFLKEHPSDRIPLSEFITNEEEAAQFLYGIYAKVKNTVFGLPYISVTDLMTDDMDYTGDAFAVKTLANLVHDNNNKNIELVWGNLYSVIGQCNILIDKLTVNPEISSDYAQVMIAEAQMMRAWSYFNLVELWGDVPLVTLPVYSVNDNLFPGRSPKADVYAQIIKDLSDASENLPETKISICKKVGTTGTYVYDYPLTLTKAAAKLMLGKAYLFNRQYDEVISVLSYFAEPGKYNEQYDTIPYQELFDTRYETSESRKKEVLWEIEARPVVDYSNGLNSNLAPNAREDPWGNKIDESMATRYQNLLPSYDLIKSYETSDKRYRYGFRFIRTAPSSLPQIMKNYDITATDADKGGANMVLLRVADAYLMLAEAYNELGSQKMASYFSTKIRKRAGLEPLPESLSYEQMRDALMLERRHEFACENSYRLFDLRRTGTYGDVMDAYSRKMQEFQAMNPEDLTEEFVDMTTGNMTPSITIPFVNVNKIWQSKHMLHPIPKSELTANPNLKINTIPNWN